MNTDLINRVAAHIEAHPESHEQGIWAATNVEYHDGEITYYDELVVSEALNTKEIACGTKCCVAGWAVVLATKEERALAAHIVEEKQLATHSWSAWGEALLGLSFEQASILFSASYDPPEGIPTALRHLAETGEIIE